MFKRVMPQQARWLAVLSAAGMATGYWQVHLTRLGLRHVLLPLVQTLAFYFLWRGFNTRKRSAFVWAGLFLGAGLYTYLAARFIFVLLLLFLIVEGLIRVAEGHNVDALWRRHRQSLILTGLLALLVFAPLGYYFAFENPEMFLERAGQVSVFNPELNQGDPAGALGHSVLLNYGSFAFYGEQGIKLNFAGRPIFGPVMALAFAIGLGLSVRYVRRAPYLFLLIWWPVMVLPAALTYVEDGPSYMRAFGIAPGIYILAALAWVSLGRFFTERFNQSTLSRLLVVIIPIAAYTSIGAATFRDYFFRWGPQPGCLRLFLLGLPGFGGTNGPAGTPRRVLGAAHRHADGV